MGSYFFPLTLFLIVIVALGAAILWVRTKRLPALLQLIACSVAFLVLATEPAAEFLQRTGSERLIFFIHRPGVVQVSTAALLACIVLFPIGFLWYALRSGTKRI